MLELAADIAPNVGLLLDSFHCHAAGTPWEQIEQIPATKIVHVHLNDAPDVPLHRLDDMKRLLPGEGALSDGRAVHDSERITCEAISA